MREAHACKGGALDCNPKKAQAVCAFLAAHRKQKGDNLVRSTSMGWLIFFMGFCYGRNFFFYVRISIKEKLKDIVTILLLNFITLPF